MISGIFHVGSGIGNQLARYVMTRVLALDKGLEFGMKNPELFKGQSFMNLDMGKEYKGHDHEYVEKRVNNEQGVDIRDYDWEGLLTIKDNTLIDGEFQGYKYYIHHLDKIREWLKVEPLDMPDDVCVINFRGGEYVGVKDLFLPKEYWDLAISKMKLINPDMVFEVHTDDIETARQFFPDYKIIRDIAINWRSIRYAKYLILSNSSFAILPALLGDAVTIYAPLYWAGRNVGYWKMRQNEYNRFIHI